MCSTHRVNLITSFVRIQIRTSVVGVCIYGGEVVPKLRSCSLCCIVTLVKGFSVELDLQTGIQRRE